MLPRAPSLIAVLVAVCALTAAAGPGATHTSLVQARDASAASSGATGATGATGAMASQPQVSPNWAGYVATARHGVRAFTSVSASWVQPVATCSGESAAYSSFWVGLGGNAPTATSMEQAGTEVDCGSDGVAHSYAWYELVPLMPVRLKLLIEPGDRISATLSYAHGCVSIRLRDRTRGTSVSRRIRFAAADTTSAEWIAEAPSRCCPEECLPMPLADFGSVTFTAATALTSAGHCGAIVSPYWAALPIELREVLVPTAGIYCGPRELVTAAPSMLGPAGSSFSVTWLAQSPFLDGSPAR
jgi:hypothetical protein